MVVVRIWNGSIRGLLVACTLCACGAPAVVAPPPPEPVAIVAKPKENTSTPQSPQPKWWEGSPPCPEGAQLRGQLPPAGNVIECVNAQGTPHGPSSVWFPNGHEGTFTEYKNGVRHGRWMHWLHGQPLVEGTYSEGRKDGDFTYWFDGETGFDVESRGDWKYNEKNYVVEKYLRGLLVKTTHIKNGKPTD